MSHEELIKFDYNGHCYTFDIADADEAEKYENAIKEMEKTEKALPKDGTLSAITRAQCRYLKDFFDAVLGHGAGNNLCGEKDNISHCIEAYKAFLAFVARQRDAIFDTRNTLNDIAPKKSNVQSFPRSNPPAPKNHQQKKHHH